MNLIVIKVFALRLPLNASNDQESNKPIDYGLFYLWRVKDAWITRICFILMSLDAMHPPCFDKVAMNKIEAIKRVNEELRANLLNERNTQWSTVVPYAGDEGWWLHIPLSGFRQEQHFLICSEKAKSFRHIRIKANTILSPATRFRCKDQMADVFISAKNAKRLVDTLPGGSKFSFDKYVFGEYNF